MEQPFLSAAIEPFLRQMAADGRSRCSIESYRRQLVMLAGGLGDTTLRQITVDRLNTYLVSPEVLLKSDGAPKRASSVNRAKSIIRAFFGWCERARLVERSPAASVRLTVASIPAPAYMTRGELQRLLRTIRHARRGLARRDHALFATLAFTGIRLSDAVGLRRSDVDLRRRELILRRTKGGSAGRRNLPARLLPVLAGLVDTPHPAGPRADGPVFAKRRGGPLSSRAIQYRFVFWLRRARIRRALSIHSLRHTFGTLLYRATKDLVLVSRALGHRDVRSTQRYAHLDDRRLARAVNGLW